VDIPKPSRKPAHKATASATHKVAASAVALAIASAAAGTLEPKGMAVAFHTSAVAVGPFASASTKLRLALAACPLHLPRWAHQWPYQGLPQLPCPPSR